MDEITYKKLDDYLKNIKKIGLKEYREIARMFQFLVEKEIKKIWKLHNQKINMRLNKIPICLEGSAVNTSTAFGFIIEEFLTQQLPANYVNADQSTVNSVFDFRYKNNEKIELLVNLKVEKNTSNNNGIVAANILKNYYKRNNKPKLYLIFKSKYHIDEKQSVVLCDNTTNIFLESFITHPGQLKSDSRNWSNVYNVLSGRLQLPSNRDIHNFNVETIPEPEKILEFMDDLAEKLIATKK